MNTQSEISIPDSWWQKYLDQYQDLMYMIAHRISGDGAVCSVEDNFSDLCIAAIESVRGFIKKTGSNIDDLLENKLFDQYTKTCLWKKKASKGALVTKKRGVRNCLSITGFSSNDEEHNGSDLLIEMSAPNIDYGAVDSLDLFEGVKQKDNRETLDAILENPTVLKNNGSFNFTELGRILGCCTMTAQKRVRSLSIEMDELGMKD